VRIEPLEKLGHPRDMLLKARERTPAHDRLDGLPRAEADEPTRLVDVAEESGVSGQALAGAPFGNSVQQRTNSSSLPAFTVHVVCE